MKTNVLLRETNKQVSVKIADDSKRKVDDIIVEKWQNIINLVAKMLHVPAGLIMQITKTHMEVFLRSENENNPYPSDGKDTLLHGLYCETVVGTDNALHIDNSLQHEAWSDNPDVSLNMISYFGLPIKWGDGTYFGTICALDSKTNEFQSDYRDLMLLFKDIIERDLIQLELNQEIMKHSEYDSLTNAFNRRKFELELDKHIENLQRYDNPFALVLLDLDGFKYVNDRFGHVTGDKVLIRFAEIVINRIRKVDLFFRYGGDEFALLLGNQDAQNVQTLMTSIQEAINTDPELQRHFIQFSYGLHVLVDKVINKEELITLADQDLYRNKKEKKARLSSQE